MQGLLKRHIVSGDWNKMPCGRYIMKGDHISLEDVSIPLWHITTTDHNLHYSEQMVEPIIECQRDFRDDKVLMVDLKCVCVCIKVHKGEF